MIIGILAVQERLTRAQELANGINAHMVFTDDDKKGIVFNTLQALEHFKPQGDDWLLLLEDDALVNEFSYVNIDALLNKLPDNIDIVSLFSYKKEMKARAIDSGIPTLFVTNYLDTNVAVLYRYNVIKDIIDFTKNNGGKTMEANITGWAVSRNKFIGYCVPQLVDHADTESFCGNAASGKRKAFNMADKKIKDWRVQYINLVKLNRVERAAKMAIVEKCKRCGGNRPIDSILKKNGKKVVYYGMCKCYEQ